MAWMKRNEHVDLRTGLHTIFLHEPESGSEHHLLITIGGEKCPHCGTIKPGLDLGEVDPKFHVKQHLELLQAQHDEMERYAQHHGVPVLIANGKVRVAR